MLVLTFWKRVTFVWQAGGLLFLNFAIGAVGLWQTGVGGYGHFFMLVSPLLAALFFGLRTGIISLVFVMLIEFVFAWAFSAGVLTPVSPVLTETTNPRAWGSQMGVVAVLGGLLIAAIHYVIPRFERALREGRDLTMRLDARNAQLERWVEERTQALERRSQVLRTSAQVAQEVSSYRDLSAALEQTVKRISEQFEFYHTGIFLINSAGTYAELRAASSPEGQRMVARGYRLQVGGRGVVGYVAAEGEPRIAQNVGKDAIYFDNPDLPQTRSEMALPLRSQDRLLGVLDVQSKRVDAFTEEDIMMLQALADQIALVIQNTRLLQEVEERFAVEREQLDEASREGWRQLLTQQGKVGFRRTTFGLSPADTAPLSARRQRAMQSADLVVDPTDDRAVALPIIVRGQIIGFIDVRKSGDAEPWTEDEKAMLRQLSEQLEITLESARLYQETQSRAARERLIGEITAQMRAVPAVDVVLETAVREIGESLGLHDVTIQLEADDGAA
jgi:GAF domain-containing protein